LWTRSDGAGTPQPLIHQVTSTSLSVPYSFTPDGKRLAFHEAGSLPQLWTVPIESDSAGLRAGKPELFLQRQFSGRQPSFSADGVWLAYASNESGVYQIYVRAFPDKGDKWQISNGGGLNPVFSPNGRELFFRNEANRIMVAEYTTKGDSFVAGKARVWSEKEIGDTAMLGSSFDVAPDGKRIAVLMPVERPEAQRTQNRVIFLENFSDELRRKVPTGK
jgi:Tol biopolymer transport system component